MYFRFKLMICMRNVKLCMDRLQSVSLSLTLPVLGFCWLLLYLAFCRSPLIRHGYCYNLNALLSLQVMLLIYMLID